MCPVSIVFKGVSPKRSFSTLGANVVRQLRAGLQRDAQGIKRDFEKTTATWKHKVNFEIRTLETAGSAVTMVGTDDPIYGFVDRGTQPHIIRAKTWRKVGKWTRRGPMIFQWGGAGSYKAKTVPGTIGSISGGPTGPVVGAMEVHHPGTEARRFSEIIQEKWQKEIPRTAAEMVKGAINYW